MSKGLQETYNKDIQGQSYELSKGAESERKKSTKRPRTGLNISKGIISVTYKLSYAYTYRTCQNPQHHHQLVLIIHQG
jgi:hypothetical protein